MTYEPIDALIERSSFGTEGARRLRSRTPLTLVRSLLLGADASTHSIKPAQSPTHTLVSGPLQQAFLAEYELSLREWASRMIRGVQMVWLKEEFEPLADALAGRSAGGTGQRPTPRDSPTRGGLLSDPGEPYSAIVCESRMDP